MPKIVSLSVLKLKVMKPERNILIDILKGFAILLVVLGHSVQYNMPGYFDNSLIFRVIYSYHMAFFMFLSGFVSYGTFDGSTSKLTMRFKTLIIPFWCWFLISYVVSLAVFYLKGGSQPDFFKSILEVLKSPAMATFASSAGTKTVVV